MKILKPVLWILLGVAVGATVIGFVPSVQAQDTNPQRRLRWIAVYGTLDSNDEVRGDFIHDPVSKGCWLVVRPVGREWLLSPAPPSACNQ